MAKCPNCEAPIAWDAGQCSGCKAIFTEESEWKPIGESHEEKERLRQRYRGVHPSLPARDASNPYAPPQANVADAGTELGRTFWVWAITIFYGIGTLWSLLSVFLITTHAIPVDEVSRAYWDKLTLFDHAMTVVNSIVSLCGIGLLFFLRARAVAFLIAGLAISTLGTLYQFVAKDLASALAGPGLVGMAIGFVLWLVIIWYANRLRKGGRLR
jgi:hypothetical protein